MIKATFYRILQLLQQIHPTKLLLLGYILYILVGWLLLLLPVCQATPLHPIDNLFTATSAVSTTGLSTVSVGDVYSFLGQLVILILIQLGGIGYATLGSFVVLSTTDKLSTLQTRVSSFSFPLPKGFVIHEFIKHVVIYTLICEVIGAIILSAIFKSEHVADAIWEGIFHSISSFCTAGFSLFPNNFENYKDDLWVNLTISALSILGAVGFIVWVDLFKRFTGQKDHIAFTTRIILSVTFWFLVIGTALFFFTTKFPAEYSESEKFLTSFFQTMSASTTVGFNSLDIGHLSFATITLLLFLMAFGASPAGTGGGLKSTTFAALLGLVKSTLRGRNSISFWQHEIPYKRIRIAAASFTYYIFILVTSLFILTLIEDKPFLHLLFEASSALSTVGLSMGITSDLSLAGKSFFIFLMFMGRVGILTFGIAISVSDKSWKQKEGDDHELVF